MSWYTCGPAVAFRMTVEREEQFVRGVERMRIILKNVGAILRAVADVLARWLARPLLETFGRLAILIVAQQRYARLPIYFGNLLYKPHIYIREE